MFKTISQRRFICEHLTMRKMPFPPLESPPIRGRLALIATGPFAIEAYLVAQ
jgi:hypothetical protein